MSLALSLALTEVHIDEQWVRRCTSIHDGSHCKSSRLEASEAVLEKRGDFEYDYVIHESTHPVKMQWHFFESSKLPVAVQSWELPVGGTEGSHTHDADVDPKDEMYLITEGHARMTVDGVSYDLSAGDSVLAPAGCAHDLLNTGDGPLRLIMVWGYHGTADYSQFGVTRAAMRRRGIEHPAA